MKAVLRLVWTYFTGTPLMRGLAILGFACAAAGMVLYLYYPPWTLGNGMRGEALWLQTLLLFAPWLGLILLFFASALLPAIVERLAFGRSVSLLPGARAAVLISVVATALLIALLTALTGFLAFFYYPTDLRPGNVFGRTLLVVFCDVSLMYVALWIVAKTRGIWLLIGSVLIAFGIFMPLGLTLADQKSALAMPGNPARAGSEISSVRDPDRRFHCRRCSRKARRTVPS